MKKKVIIIGAGIGGLSASIQLAYAGFDVTVIEKRSVPGGKIIQIQKDGFTFDGGASFITLTKVYEDFFNSVGKKRSDYIQWEQMKINTTFHFANGKQFSLFSDEQKVRDEIVKRFPGNEKGFDRFMHKASRIYSLLYEGPQYAQKNYHKLMGFEYLFHPKALSHLSILTIHKSWQKWVQECFSAPELQAVFSYQATFMGMHPKDALATYSFLTWAEIRDGMYQVKGGTYGIVEGFYRLARELGVHFQFDTEVTGLDYSGKTITGVKTHTQVIPADIVVSNTDGAYFYQTLMPQAHNTHFKEPKLRSMKHTNSYFTLNLGLSSRLPDLDHHTFYIGKDWPEYFNLLFQSGSVPKLSDANLCYYAIQPVSDADTMAPPGKSTLFILVPVPGYDPGFDWAKYEDTFKNVIYDSFQLRSGINIRELVEVEELYSPARWGKEFNLWENIILGFSLNFFQINNFRMPNKSREFNNLYFTGTSTIPGPGLPPCITSGRLVTERILEHESP